jgi:hypothetical protein
MTKKLYFEAKRKREMEEAAKLNETLGLEASGMTL